MNSSCFCSHTLKGVLVYSMKVLQTRLAFERLETMNATRTRLLTFESAGQMNGLPVH